MLIVVRTAVTVKGNGKYVITSAKLLPNTMMSLIAFTILISGK